jgi:hypothetical protein
MPVALGWTRRFGGPDRRGKVEEEDAAEDEIDHPTHSLRPAHQRGSCARPRAMSGRGKCMTCIADTLPQVNALLQTIV